MSRRRGEFEHRTSIFEGAFRAWSHLGGIDPYDLEKKSADDMDPLTNPIAPADDTRVKSNATFNRARRDYPYEPLPRSGLAHPFVQAILSPWLGPDADQDAIALGLTTLRTWWQHRRKGESGSAVAALSTDKMQGVVDGYTRHFFTLAHCLVVNDKEQPPRSLHTKMKIRDKQRRKAAGGGGGVTGDSLSESEKSRRMDAQSEHMDTDLSPLERLHAAQQRQLKDMEGLAGTGNASFPSVVNMKGKCIPGKVDLAGVVDSVNRHAAQLAHRGTELPSVVDSRGTGGGQQNSSLNQSMAQYGDPGTMPIVFCDFRGDCQMAMSVDGITCAHCVKIVETVLKGCNGNRSPIVGLLDAAADRAMNSVLIKIEHPADAKRIAFESARNLAMVGYTAKALEVEILDEDKRPYPLEAVCHAIELIAMSNSGAVFDWNILCSCPDNGVQRQDCPRHTQMDPKVLEAFVSRGLEIVAYLKANPVGASKDGVNTKDSLFGSYDDQPAGVSQAMAGPPLAPTYNAQQLPMTATGTSYLPSSVSVPSEKEMMLRQSFSRASYARRASRNPSILSFGNGLRQTSMTSETTFGRAMSGLSALSIDWENLDDFDLEVDHSAHINNQARPSGPDGPQPDNNKHAVGV